jgi:hypothetical protein
MDKMFFVPATANPYQYGYAGKRKCPVFVLGNFIYSMYYTTGCLVVMLKFFSRIASGRVLVVYFKMPLARNLRATTMYIDQVVHIHETHVGSP